MKYAHYFKSGLTHFVIICDNMQAKGGRRYDVTGKRAARDLAKAHGAKAWNF